MEFKELLVKFFRLLFYPVSFFRLEFSAKCFADFLGIFVNLVHSFSEFFLIEDDLGCWIDVDGFKLFKRPLRHDIKASDRLDLITPKFYSERILFRKVKNIDDISSYRKLAGSLYLIVSDISHRDKALCDLGLIDRNVSVD